MKKKFLNFSFSKISENNTFVLIFSLILSIVIWFYIEASSQTNLPKQIYDVPITINLSESAQAEGVKVFDQNIAVAKVSVTGNDFVLGQLDMDNVEIIATLSPVTNKISGKTMNTETLTLVARKKDNLLADFQVVDVDPQTIQVTYDRFQEKNFVITNELNYVSSEDVYVSPITLEDERVSISGPESSIGQISKVSVSGDLTNLTAGAKEKDVEIKIYDINGNELDPVKLYLDMSIERTVANYQVLNKKTVDLSVNIFNAPTDFSISRITITPNEIDIAGDLSLLDNYNSIILPKSLDFSEINLENSSFNTEIPMPDNISNLSNIENATINIDLSGYSSAELSTTKINIANVPNGKEVKLVNLSIDAEVLGPAAQIAKLTGDSLLGVVDMANYSANNGNVEVPISLTLSGSDSCWIYGKYTILVNVSDKQEEETSSTN